MHSEWTLLRGTDEPPAEPLALRAGPLSMLFEPETGSLRYVRLGDREVIRGVYAAVRDQFWNTIPPRVEVVELDRGDDRFALAFKVECRQGPIDFTWTGRINGEPSGEVTFDFDGVARSTFLRNRIGFCVLHPIRECAGQPCVLTHSDGRSERSQFPHLISPHQPFLDLSAITHQVAEDVRAEVRFDGDVFETEDQRNWTDASFKTYCTPLDRTKPVEVREGEWVRHSVMIRLYGEPRTSSVTVRDDRAALLGGGVALPRLPKVGLGSASHGRPLSEREVGLLRALKLDHLRVDCRGGNRAQMEPVRRAQIEARVIGASLEIALFFGSKATPEVAAADHAPEWNHLKELAERNDARRPWASRWVYFREDGSPVPGWIGRETWGRNSPGTEFGTGTDVYFTELNREWPAADGADFVCYSVNPQVHAYDDRSLVETLDGLTETVRSARALYPGMKIAVTPVTLRPRFNPNGAGVKAEGELPSEVDPRQMSLFAAAWTLGSLRRLAEAGVDSVTYYETTGWRGVIETDDGEPSHPRFHSIPGAVFPVYHLFADLADLRAAPVDCLRPTHPLVVEGLSVMTGRGRVTLVANLTATPQAVTLFPDRPLGPARVRVLDTASAGLAMRSPEEFRASAGRPLEGRELVLPPYAVARTEEGADDL